MEKRGLLLMAVAVAFLFVGVRNAAVITLNVSPTYLIPGASATINFTLNGWQWNSGSSGGWGGDCVAPGYVNLLLVNSTTPCPLTVPYTAAGCDAGPFPNVPCTIGWSYNSSTGYTTNPHDPDDYQTATCSTEWFTSHNLLPGNYTVCAYNVTTTQGQTESGPTQISPPLHVSVPLEITGNDTLGYSWGAQVLFQQPGSTSYFTANFMPWNPSSSQEQITFASENGVLVQQATEPISQCHSGHGMSCYSPYSLTLSGNVVYPGTGTNSVTVYAPYGFTGSVSENIIMCTDPSCATNTLFASIPDATKGPFRYPYSVTTATPLGAYYFNALVYNSASGQFQFSIGPVGLTVDPATSTLSPYISYYIGNGGYYPGGGLSPGNQIEYNTQPICATVSPSSSNPLIQSCFIEIANLSHGGCVTPAEQFEVGAYSNYYAHPQNPAINSCSSGQLPCFLSTDVQGSISGAGGKLVGPSSAQSPYSTLATGFSATLPAGLLPANGNFVVCAYDYLQYVSMPNGANAINAYTQSVQSRALAVNWNESIFYGAANITCSNGSCTPGTSVQAPSVSSESVGTAGSEFGVITFSPAPPIETAPGYPISITANVYDVGSTPLALYFGQISGTGLHTSGFCPSGPGSININDCTGRATSPSGSPLSGCFACTPSGGPSGYTCSNPAGSPIVSGGPTCEVWTGGVSFGLPSYAGMCSWTTSTGVFGSSGLPAGQYIYCLLATGPASNPSLAPKFISAGIITVLAPGAAVPPNYLGNALVSPLGTAVCSTYSQINSILFVVALTLMLLGALLYGLSNIIPAQTRGTIQSYAIGMFLGGVVGVLVASASVYLLSVASNVPIANILSSCTAYT